MLILASGLVTFSKANRPLLIKIKAKIKLSKYCDVTIGCIFCRRLKPKKRKKSKKNSRKIFDSLFPRTLQRYSDGFASWIKKKKTKKKQIGTRSTYNPSGGNMKSVLKGTGSLLVKVGNVPVALLGSFNVSRKFSLMACWPVIKWCFVIRVL